jgi:hypothetical protein
MNYCRDCKYYETDVSAMVAKCLHERASYEDPRFGLVFISPEFSQQRTQSLACAFRSMGKCGPDAKFYEAKEAKP